MKKRLLIIGSSGSLGKILIKQFKKNKYDIFHTGLKFKKFDLTRFNSIYTLLKKSDPQLIINCSAITDLDFCETNKVKSKKVNIGIVENLFIIKKRFKFNFKLIQISTDQMYNNKVGLKSNENAKPIVLNEYTKQKLAVEKICLKNKALILRLNFFSNTKKNILGWVLNSCKSNENIYLFNDIYFNPLSVTTLSKIISKIVSKFFIKDINGIYNLGSKDNLNKSDFCKYIINKKFPNFKNYKVVSSKKFFKIKRPKNMTMNINKFEKKFNICLPYIKNEINNYLKNNVKI